MISLIASLLIALGGCHSTASKIAEPRTLAPPASIETQTMLINSRNNQKALIYVQNDTAMVQVDGQAVQRLIGINPALYKDFPSIFFRVQDKNHDGYNDLAVMASSSFGGGEFCYDVFLYQPKTQQFNRVDSSFYCSRR